MNRLEGIVNELTRNNILNMLNEEDITELAKMAIKKHYSKGEYLFHQEDVWQNMLFISSGELKWSLFSPDGKRQIVFGLVEGDIVVAHSLVDGKGMPASLEVSTECEIYLWPKEVVVPILSRNPQSLWEIMRILVTNMRKVRNVVYGFSFHTAPKRLAKLLLDYYNPKNGDAISRDLTLDEMAAEVGTTRELICKILYDFAKEGTLDITRKSFIFTDTDKLEDIAGRD